jgi:cytochrome c-type biogenesis protein CcmH/NrfG
VARGTQHRKRRPGADASKNGTVASVSSPRRHKQKPPEWQEQLFFQRLRNHAKVVFVFLAAVFALSFVFLGVGSGSTGISDALQNLFSSSGGSSTSISSLEKKTQQHPLVASGWRDLATAYEAKQNTAGAITALAQLTALQPKNTDALGELANQYTLQAQQYATDYQTSQQQVQDATPLGQAFAPASTTTFGKIFNDPNGLQDPIAAAVQSLASTVQNTAYTNYQAAQSQAEQTYQKLVKLSPNDPNAQLQLGQSAQSASDTVVAIAAYKKFLKLAPHDPLASQVKQQLALLAASAAASSTSKSGSK